LSVLILTVTLRTASAQSVPPSGSFGFLIDASYNDPSQTNGSAILGLMNFDGAGNVTGSYTSEPDTQADHTNAGGFSGSYSDNPDGTGSISITLDTGTTFTFATVMVDGGQGLRLVTTDCSGDCEIGGNALVSGVARVAYTGPVMGTYGFESSISPKPSRSVGVVTFDGAGNATQSLTGVFLSGTKGQPSIFTSGTQAGIYTLNSDGSGTIDFAATANNNRQQFAFVVTDGGSGFLFVQTRRLGNGVSFGSARLQ
jgi:hypothetical protein